METRGVSTIAIVIVVAIIVAAAAGGVFILTRPSAPKAGTPDGGENAPGGGEIPPGDSQTPQQSGEISVVFTGSSYQSVTQKPTGWFTTGQEADIVLGLTDFDGAEPTLFNHPTKVATDGTRLVLADTWNNRVLIWNSIPTQNNQPPDLVVGQENLYSNTPGLAGDKLNWPVGVATDGQRLIVADATNNRILIWNQFPTQNGEDADLVLGAPDFTTRTNTLPGPGTGSKEAIIWAWDVFTDGTMLIVANTGASRISIWNQFPTQNNQPADVVLTSAVGISTPRSAYFDGQHLIVGDYNAKKTFVWNQMPQSDDTPYDYTLWGQGFGHPFLWASSTVDGKLLGALDYYVAIWNQFPTSSSVQPDITIGMGVGTTIGNVNISHGGLAATANKLILSEFNHNRVSIFNSIPASSGAVPDVVLGAPDLQTNTLLENYNCYQNAAVFSDGDHLFVGSEFDGRFTIFKELPDQSVAIPDIVYEGMNVIDTVVYDNKLVVAGGGMAMIWNNIPLAGENYDITLGAQIEQGESVWNVGGVAADANYLFVSDSTQNKIYVWEGGIPTTSRTPDFTIDVNNPGRLSSDGQHLAVATGLNADNGILIWDLPLNKANLSPNIVMSKHNLDLNLPQGVFVDGTHLFVGDTSHNRVLIWNSIPATGTEFPDIVLGQQNLTDVVGRIAKDGLYMPSSLCFDGSYLWVGEYKFSNRVLRFSVHQ